MLENKRQDKGWKPSSANGCFYYTYKHLSKEDMEYLGSLPEEMQVNVEGCPELFICHGIPGNVRGNVDYNPELKDSALQNLNGKYLLGGHSHIQEVYKMGFVLNRAVKKTIITGKNHVLECVTEVEKETGLLPHLVPEDIWEKVAQKLEV